MDSFSTLQFFASLFDERVILLRTLVYTFGWVTLVLSTVAIIHKAIQFYHKTNHSSLSKLVLPLLFGWLITMYSLGVVATIYMLDMPQRGMLVTFPVFLVWTITMIGVYIIASRWGNETMQQYRKVIDINKELQIANEHLQKLDKLKSEFISIAAHQLRTPLSAIKWSVKMVLDGEVGMINEEQKEILYKGYQDNDRMITLVNDLLDAPRIESGEFAYIFTDESLTELIQNVVDAFKEQARENHIEISYIKPGDALYRVRMDTVKLKTALDNLVDNALKYTKPGGRVKISLQSAGDVIQITISDTGIGIPEDQKSRIFSKFYRGGNAIALHPNGSGLGLFIAKKIIEKHGGNVSVKSQEGKGTQIHIGLPVSR